MYLNNNDDDDDDDDNDDVNGNDIDDDVFWMKCTHKIQEHTISQVR